MKKTLQKTSDYTEFLNDIRGRIRNAQVSASRILNKGLVKLYWSIGKDIVEKQEKLGWGKAVVERLSRDLKKDFPNAAGYSPQNLWLMRQFYLEYRNDPILQQAVGVLAGWCIPSRTGA